MSFRPNLSKKQYERHVSEIKRACKNNSSERDNILRKLEISEKYDSSYDLKEVIPTGLTTHMIENRELLDLAKTEVLAIYNCKTVISDRLTNYRFYINTPYFDRKGTDEFPLFHLDDPRVRSISQLIRTSPVLKDITYDPSLLNILVRVYRSGDVLNFHTDRDIFGETIYGLVLENCDESRGIMLTNGKSRYVVNEVQGLIWSLTGEARWEYEHGYSTNWKSSEDIVRIVISFRFFQNSKQIPKKKFEEF